MLHFSLDIRSLSVMVTGVCVMVSVTMALVWITRKTYPGFGFWTAGTAASAAGFLLISLRGMIPVLFTIVLANVFVITAAALYLDGTHRFCGVTGRRTLSFFVVIVYALLIAYFTYVDDDAGVRITSCRCSRRYSMDLAPGSCSATPRRTKGFPTSSPAASSGCTASSC